MGQLVATSEIIPATDRLWVPGTHPHGFKVEMLSEPQVPVSVEELFAPKTEIAREIARRWVEHDMVRVATSSDELLPNEVVVTVTPTVDLERSDLLELIDSGSIDAMLRYYPIILGALVEESGLEGAFPEAERVALTTTALKTLQERLMPDWADLPPQTLEHATQISQIIRFSCAGREVQLYNFTNTIVDEIQAGKVANGLRELCDETGGAALDAITVMAIADVRDPLLYPLDEDGKHRTQNAGVAEGGAIILAEDLFNPSIPALPIDDSPDFDLTDTSEQPFEVAGDAIQLTTFHEGLHVVALRGKKSDTEPTARFATATGWNRVGWLRWVHKTAKPSYQGPSKNPYTYGQRNPQEDITTTGEANFAGGEAEERLDEARRIALRGLYTSLHSGVIGPNFVTVRELPLPRADRTYGMPPLEHIVIRPAFIYRVTDREQAAV